MRIPTCVRIHNWLSLRALYEGGVKIQFLLSGGLSGAAKHVGTVLGESADHKQLQCGQ